MFDQLCVSRVLPASSTHRLFEGDHPQYTTKLASRTEKFFALHFGVCLTFQWGPWSLRPANTKGEFFHLLMKAGAVLEGFGVFCFATEHAKMTCSDGCLACYMSKICVALLEVLCSF